MATRQSAADVLRPFFPKLEKGRDYEVTSQDVDTYNCVAWIMRDTSNWWEPGNPDGYWPRPASWDVGIEEYLWAFRARGFGDCTEASLETGIEKIAVYGYQNKFRHVAFQRSDGRWSSKIGSTYDVWHNHPDSLAGGAINGSVVAVMQRLRKEHLMADGPGLLLP